MKKNQESRENNNSLNTFFIYFIIVALIISGALIVRSVYILRQSKFDGSNITVAVTHNKKVVSLIGLDSKNRLISILDVDSGNISVNNLSTTLGLISESQINSAENISKNSADSIFMKSIYGSGGVSSDLTIFDKVRLWLFSKNVSPNEIKRESITSIDDEVAVDKQIKDLFTYKEIVSENFSIQVINSTEIPGLGQNLERIIVNRGGNVVSVSSSRGNSPNSRIEYFGRNSYTLNKFQKMLKYPVKKSDSKTIADIVIIIGEDYKKYSML